MDLSSLRSADSGRLALSVNCSPERSAGDAVCVVCELNVRPVIFQGHQAAVQLLLVIRRELPSSLVFEHHIGSQ